MTRTYYPFIARRSDLTACQQSPPVCQFSSVPRGRTLMVRGRWLSIVAWLGIAATADLQCRCVAACEATFFEPHWASYSYLHTRRKCRIRVLEEGFGRSLFRFRFPALKRDDEFIIIFNCFVTHARHMRGPPWWWWICNVTNPEGARFE